MANARFTQFFYTKHMMPTLIDCQFLVDPTNVNGLGISGLKGPGVTAVYMHTSATPAATNPNPANGYVYIQFMDNYFRDYGGYTGMVTPPSGSDILVASAGTVASTTYVITTVGTTTAAGWQSLGLPVGIVPAVNVPFVATATTTATGTGAVQVPHVNGSGVTVIETVGDASLTLGPAGNGRGAPYALLRFMGPTNSTTTTPIAVAPRDQSLVKMKFYFSNSSVKVAGE